MAHTRRRKRNKTARFRNPLQEAGMSASGFSRFRLTLTGCALIGLLVGGTAFGVSIELVSRTASPGLSDTAADSGRQDSAPAVSRDGRYVAFLSAANNLVSGQVDRDTNDVFLYDRVARTTTLVSHTAASSVTTGNAVSFAPAISADGRWVVYPSSATDLVDGPPPVENQSGLCLWDRVTGATTLISSRVDSDSDRAVSADGRFIAFIQPDGVGGGNVFLYDRTSRQTVLVSRTGQPDRTSPDFSMSADGRFVAFDSYSEFFPPDPGSGAVYLYDRTSGTVSRVAAGYQPVISADGGTIAYLSGSSILLYSRATRTAVLASHAAGRPTAPANRSSSFPPGSHLLSADGRYIAFFSSATDLVPGQVAKNSTSLFLYDRTSGTVSLASRAGGSPRNPSPYPDRPTMSADGRFIAFISNDPSLAPGPSGPWYSVDVFLFDRKAGKTTRVSAGRGSAPHGPNGAFSYTSTLSADGSQIAFYSNADDLVAGVRDLNDGYDLFVYDIGQRAGAVATRHPPGMASLSPQADSYLRGLSADGRWVLFEGPATGLVPGEVDANGQSDVFLYDHATRTTTLVSHAGGAAATAGDGPSWQSALSADGRFVAFTSYATNLDPTVSDYVDTSTGQHRNDVFLFDRVTGKTLALSRSARHPGLTGDFESGKPAISADGRWVAFMSSATDLVPATDTATGNVYLYDRVLGTLKRTGAGATSRGSARPLTLSADGRYLAVLTPEPRGYDVYLYDRVAGAQTLVSHAPDGTAAGDISQDETPAFSADGRFVAFVSGRGDLGGAPGGDVNVYLWDRESGAVTLAGASDRRVRGSMPRHPVLSADGRWLAFLSNKGLVPGSDNGDQVYLYDRVSGALTLVGTSRGILAISADGRYIANGLSVYDRVFGAATVLAAVPVYDLLLSADGHSLAFQSPASYLVFGDFNGTRADVFLFSGVTP
jgi:Tol biopolymer transport system component